MNTDQTKQHKPANKSVDLSLKKATGLKKLVVSGVLIGSSALFASNNAYADATIEVITDEQPVTVLVKNQKVLLKLNGAQQQSEAIYDQRTQTLHVVDHSNQTIFPLNEKTINELSGTVNAAVGAMEQQLEGMTPEQRSQMEKMMGSLGLSMPEKETKPEVTLSRVREYSYSNIKCDESKVMEGDQALATVCVSQGNTTQLSEPDYQSLLEAQSFMFSLARQAKQFAKQVGQQVPNIGDLKLNGLLVNSLQDQAYGNAGATASFRIKAINVGDVEEIVIPTEYRERSLLN